MFAQDIEFQKKSLECDFENVIHFSIDESIIADFNGDGINDTAVFRKENKTSGIIIKHGQTEETVSLGFGKDFAHLTDFNWVDFWGLVKDSTTYEMVFNETDILGDTIISLKNPSIVVRKEEAGGGVITLKNGIYIWIHQSD
ncbi:hypothetical protein D1614_14115 [Maribellus luteus]|uniref:VCBS repeat-containing protein n=1 Tax=Maribellus luteus TaxID=2305463 RepID=A0A399SUN8_9BACT|nr:hypothetical protein D1614_14115 [Maribellus luteus]